jgi:drug/metabolite transporter (DMT)-like permease
MSEAQPPAAAASTPRIADDAGPAQGRPTDLPPPAPTRLATPAALLPLLAAAGASAAFIGMDASVKLLSGRFDALQLTFLRFAAGSAFAVPLWLCFRTALPSRSHWPFHLLRCALLLVALVGYFHALTLLPLIQAVAMGYTAPILISLLAMLVLRERPSRWIWLALALGAAGVGVALWPELSQSGMPGSRERIAGLLSAAVSALSYSGVVVLARHQAQRDALWTIMLVQNLLPLAVLSVPMVWRWQPLQGSEWAVVTLMGALATLGLLGITWAFTHLEASRVAPLEYTGFVWAGLLGWLLFGERPSLWTWGSIGLIALGCLLLLKPARKASRKGPGTAPAWADEPG